MKINENNLRKLISDLILETSNMHRCLDGRIVPFESNECMDDVEYRIEDAVFHRDQCSLGSDQRLHLNGLLKGLRKKKRQLSKIVVPHADLELGS